MTVTGSYPNGTPVKMCETAWELFRAWLASTQAPDSDDIFDNEAGRAYWQHRDTCPDCTGRRETNDKQ